MICQCAVIDFAASLRPGWQKNSPDRWHDASLDVFETRGILPIADWRGGCCFAAVRDSWLQQLVVRGSSWGQEMDGKEKEEQDNIWKKLLEQSGAKPTSAGLSVPVLVLVLILLLLLLLLSNTSIATTDTSSSCSSSRSISSSKDKPKKYFGECAFRGAV